MMSESLMGAGEHYPKDENHFCEPPEGELAGRRVRKPVVEIEEMKVALEMNMDVNRRYKPQEDLLRHLFYVVCYKIVGSDDTIPELTYRMVIGLGLEKAIAWFWNMFVL